MESITATKFKKFNKLKSKIKMATKHNYFLKKCKRLKIFPEFMRVKYSFKNEKSNKIFNRAKPTYFCSVENFVCFFIFVAILDTHEFWKNFQSFTLF